MLAIIAQEGTGSFNTSFVNLGADGGAGAETDYKKDLRRANDLVLGKLLGYAYYGKQFNEFMKQETAKGVSWAGNDSYGDAYNYLNWQTPILRLNEDDSSKNRVDFGVYAQDGANWHTSVWYFYGKFVGEDGAQQAYSDYILNFGKSKVEDIYKKSLPDIDFYVDPNTSIDIYGNKTKENIINTKLR